MPAAGNVTVPTSVLNIGNVRLDAVTIPGRGGCILGTLEPRQAARCNTTVFAVTQDDFEAAQVVATATATATPRGNTTAAVTGELSSSKTFALEQRRSLAVASTASASNVTVAGKGL
jgi:citrate lyase beta subunit